MAIYGDLMGWRESVWIITVYGVFMENLYTRWSTGLIGIAMEGFVIVTILYSIIYLLSIFYMQYSILHTELWNCKHSKILCVINLNETFSSIFLMIQLAFKYL